MSYTFYKLVHLSGIFLLILGLGATASHIIHGGTKENFKRRKLFMNFHGLGLLLSFIAGFGLIAKGGHSFASGWIYIKLLVWLILGAYPVIFYKQKAGDLKPLFGLIATLFTALLFVEFKFF